MDTKYADSVDTKGQTLIPPKLIDFATTFAQDIEDSLGITLPVSRGDGPSNTSIFLTHGSEDAYLDAAGRPTSEGYSIEVSSNGVTITGASPLGAWWGTRTILQQWILGNGSIPQGKGQDSPGWGTRGAMLDVARHYYPPDFIIELCSYLSYFKQNVFHLHLSDNLYNNVAIYTKERSLELYAAFRPNSPAPAVAGLNKRPNESYYEEDFENIQQKCASRGVTIIPEIEAPGHALVITQWKPELGLEDELSLLNITHPETITTMETIWGTFLNWFHSKTVHIGADEYTGPKTDYPIFVNAMSRFIGGVSDKTIRIWGTFAPDYSPGAVNVHQNVSIQHWAFFEANPYYSFVKNNYSVLNSDDTFYVVGKWSGSYPQVLKLDRIFNGNPSGGPYSPHIFDTKNATNNPARDNPLILGHIFPIWNDFGPNSTAVTEAYYSWRIGSPALADKQWGGDLSKSEYLELFPKLHSSIPGQNLDRSIPSKSSTVLEYDFSDATKVSNGTITDLSGNGYDATLSTGCNIQDGVLQLSQTCTLTTPLDSKGRDFTLSLTIKPTTNQPAPLLRGRDSNLWFGYQSSTSVTFETGGNFYALNYTLPVGSWSNINIIGRGNATYFKVGDSQEMQFLTKLGINGARFVWAPMAIEAPLKVLGGEGFEGEVKKMVLSNEA